MPARFYFCGGDSAAGINFSGFSDRLILPSLSGCLGLTRGMSRAVTSIGPECPDHVLLDHSASSDLFKQAVLHMQ